MFRRFWNTILPMSRLAIDGGRPVRKTFLVFGKPCIEASEVRAVSRVLKSCWISTGPHVHALEKEFAKYTGSADGVAVSSCTAALHLALILAGAKAGREVITTPLTFVATSEAILYTGAKVVYADVNPFTGQIDPGEIRKKITTHTVAIMPVDYAGYPAPLDEIMAIAKQHKLKVVEDAAHATETKCGTRKVGAIADYTCFSFYATKNLAGAEGGLITVNSKETGDRLRVMRLHGMSKDAWRRYGSRVSGGYDVTDLGFKYNLTDIQAAMVREQLKKVNRFWKRRRQIVNIYERHFKNSHYVETLTWGPGRNAYHFFPIFLKPGRLTKTRDEVLAAVSAENIGVGVHFTPTHLFTHYRNLLGHQSGDFPHAERLGLSEISLPVYPHMTDRDVADTLKAVEKVFEAYRR